MAGRYVVVTGAGGFIGGHLVADLLSRGDTRVRAVDCKALDDWQQVHDGVDNVVADLRHREPCKRICADAESVYQLAADMGGAGFVFTGENDADIMHNSGLINLNMLEACYRRNSRKIFYSSSACMYPEYNQTDPDNPKTSEDSAYPAQPDSEYGWEKLFRARIYLA